MLSCGTKKKALRGVGEGIVTDSGTLKTAALKPQHKTELAMYAKHLSSSWKKKVSPVHCYCNVMTSATHFRVKLSSRAGLGVAGN